MQKLVLLGLMAAIIAPAALAQGVVTDAAPVVQGTVPVAPPAEGLPAEGAPVEGVPAPQNPAAPQPNAAAPAPTSGFNAQIAFSPTYTSGYYYASPYAGYTSLSYYGSIYTARGFGG